MYSTRIMLFTLLGATAAQTLASFNVSSVTQSAAPRIAGGAAAAASAYPWHVIVEVSDPSLAVCGGALVAPDTIVTSALCIKGAIDGSILFGIQANADFRDFKESKVYLVPEKEYGPNDLAMIVLDKPVVVREGSPVNVIKLITKALHVAGHPAGEVTLTGFGYTDVAGTAATSLQVVTLTVLPNLDCQNLISGVTRSTICTSGVGNKGGCMGDLGAPLAQKIGGEWMLVGLLTTIECNSGKPSAYTRVGIFLDFINEGHMPNQASAKIVSVFLTLALLLPAAIRCVS